MLDSFEHLLDEVWHACLVIGVSLEGYTVGDNLADSYCLVSKHAGETCKGSRLHLVVGNAMAFVFEFLDALVDERRGNGKSQDASLWAIEADRRNSYAGCHVIASNTGCKFLIGMHNVWIGSLLRIPDERGKLALEVEVGHFVAIGIPVEDAVEADTDVRNDVGTQGK